MSDDIFDTRFEGKEVELKDHRIGPGEDVNLMEKDPTLKKITLGAGWDMNAFDTDTLDLDISLFLLDRNRKTRIDDDFIFYNQPEALDGGIKHGGDNRLGAGDGDDESIFIDLEAVPFDVLQIAIVLSIYKGYEKQQSLESVRNAYIRLANAENEFELTRFELKDALAEHEETGAIIAYLNREGPKWHLKTDMEFFKHGLSEIARGYNIIINQE
ncbi:MAG: TerD family protein [Micavibrio sp.]|nr:TerD family protein [Micavibrio sp.]